MSDYCEISAEEMRAVWASWKGMKGHKEAPPPSLNEQIEGCMQSAIQAAKGEAHFRHIYNTADIVSSAHLDAKYQIRRHISEQKHWRGYVRWLETQRLQKTISPVKPVTVCKELLSEPW
jgi:hypothetical protein